MPTITLEHRPGMETLHTGDIIRTFTGLYINVLKPSPDVIAIEDIAHALSQVCRFAGHTHKFYSVAQHCVECFVQLHATGCRDKKMLLTMLLHDATEAYVGDLARPIKRQIPQYKQVENLLMAAIAEKFDLYFPFPELIKKVDNFMLEVEHNSLILRKEILPIREPADAKAIFLTMYRNLVAA